MSDTAAAPRAGDPARHGILLGLLHDLLVGGCRSPDADRPAGGRNTGRDTAPAERLHGPQVDQAEQEEDNEREHRHRYDPQPQPAPHKEPHPPAQAPNLPAVTLPLLRGLLHEMPAPLPHTTGREQLADAPFTYLFFQFHPVLLFDFRLPVQRSHLPQRPTVQPRAAIPETRPPGTGDCAAP